ncbi:antirestriction protein [Rhodococcus sp. ACS1]|uniref:antirestriction protein ArdA n=1 Tax=Rhodococcus sp. ACS1 TaxID=2028570 RepID=UPI000BB13525|nr:antirestriction protein ArdA [Rhodococcus sp. ACS1]PBC38619.1 antirestriction protein [Rhodococcus sp. ACS1]
MNDRQPHYNSGNKGSSEDQQQSGAEEYEPGVEAAAADSETGHEEDPAPNPLIYVASVADYEAGRTHGVWLEAAREPEAIYDDIHRMLESSSVPDAERFAIRDSEGFGVARVYENDSIELVSTIARGIAEHGHAFAAWADVNEGASEHYDHFARAYIGHYASLAAYAQQLMQEMGYEALLDTTLPEDLRQHVHIDYDAVAQGLFRDGHVQVYKAPGGGVWLFDERA